MDADTANVSARLRELARERPDAPAVIDAQFDQANTFAITYAAFDRIVDGVARRALAHGWGPRDCAALLVKPHWPLVALKLGFARAGIPICTIPSVSATVAIVLIDDGLHAGATVVVDETWWRDPGADASTTPVPMGAGGDALFQLQATSGTTGVPKLVPVTHAMMRARMHVADTYPHPGDVRLLCTSGPGGGYGMRHMLRAFERGGLVVLADSTGDTAALIERHRINLLVASPYSVTRMLATRDPSLPRFATLEQVSIGGSLLSSDLVRTVSARVCEQTLCTFGSTEAGSTAVGPGNAMRGMEGAAGFIHPGVEVEAVDDDDRPLPHGQTGRLRVRAPGQAFAYHNDAATSAVAFRHGWFYSGDIGRVTADRILVVEGRVDDLINVGGSKYAPQVFERVLLSVPGVTEAAAFPAYDPMGRFVPNAAIVASAAVDLAAIQAAFRREPSIPSPVVVMKLARLPRDDQGKVLRRELAAMVKRMGAKPPPTST